MKSSFKTIGLALAGLGMAAAAVPASAQAWQSINQRQRNIDVRIDQGVRNGSLTRPEALRLRAQFRDLSNLENRYRRSGGGLSVGERRDLNTRFNRLSARVQIERNDRQNRR
ncbi:hypothetical protein [Sphingomonas radiodurans]|uniref:hypothetical protein n=1 Tax=Sphingomonas radiodurans TaxID=2890321 RepID=UPI001E5D70FB|nr:hypothetical protein [Sphingomonas radiodurans]WBH15367.1 hypothetical protein LLW23_10980 [Sphingomonas radiodurans]